MVYGKCQNKKKNKKNIIIYVISLKIKVACRRFYYHLPEFGFKIGIEYIFIGNVSIQMLEISNFWSKLYPFIKIEGSFHEVSSMTREAGFTSMGSPRNLL